MKIKLIIILLTLSINSFAFGKDYLPFKKENIEKIYKLENGNLIFIEQYERGDRVWEKDFSSNKYNNISHVWNFIALAKNCEGIKQSNIYFAHNLEYYVGGGANHENPQIRIFDLYDPSPWRNTDLGIVPNMKHTKQWCNFYKEIKIMNY